MNDVHIIIFQHSKCLRLKEQKKTESILCDTYLILKNTTYLLSVNLGSTYIHKYSQEELKLN